MGRLLRLQPVARVAIAGWLDPPAPALRRLGPVEDARSALSRAPAAQGPRKVGQCGYLQPKGTVAAELLGSAASRLHQSALPSSGFDLHGKAGGRLIRRTAVVRTRMPGGVGGVASRDVPLSRFTASCPPQRIGTEIQCCRAAAVPAANVAAGSSSADFEDVVELPLAAWRGLAARFCAFDLPLTDIGEDGAEVLVLDDAGLRNVPQLVKGGVGQVAPAVTDRQPAVGIIDNGDALAAECAGDLVRLQQEQNLVVLQGQAVGNRPLFAPGEDVGEVVAGRQWPMQVLGVARFLAEAGVVIGQESRQQLIAGGNRADPLKAQFLDQAIL